MPYRPARIVRKGIDDLLPQGHRSPGWHVSDIIGDYWTAMGKYEQREFVLTEAMKLGNIHEYAIIHRYAEAEPGRYRLLGELECEGLYLTPDLGDSSPWTDSPNRDLIGSTEQAILEIKNTALKDPAEGLEYGMPESSKYDAYWMQLGAYCYAGGVRIGRLHVLHNKGDYRSHPPEPTAYTWEKVWTRRELVENWALIMSHRAVMIAEGRVPESAHEGLGGTS